MKDLLYTLSLFMLISCNQNEPKVNTLHHADSLLIGDKLYYLDSISLDDYNRVEMDRYAGEIDTSIVKVFPDSILIKTLTQLVVYKNDSSSGDEAAYYKIKSMFPVLGYVHIEGDHWEWTSDSYVNLKNGSQTFFWDNPILSPDRKHILSYSCDLEALYMENGIQLFRIEEDKITKLFEKEIADWGPSEVKWESDSTVLIKRLKLDSKMNEFYDYLRMKLN